MGDDVAGQCGQHGEQYRAPDGRPSYAADPRRGAALIEEMLTMPLHERDVVRDQLDDCVFADRDLTRPVAKYRFPQDGTLPVMRSSSCRTN